MTEKTIKEHITELKKYVLIILVFGIIVFSVLFAYSKTILTYLFNYYNFQVYSLTITEGLELSLNFSLVGTVILLLPIILICLALYLKDESIIIYKYILKTLFIVIPLVFLGGVFGVYISQFILNTFEKFSIGIFTPSATSVLMILISTTGMMIITFQFLYIIPLLIKIGIIKYDLINKTRAGLIICILIITSFFTPDTTFLSSTLLTIPIYLSIEGGFSISKIMELKLWHLEHKKYC